MNGRIKCEVIRAKPKRHLGKVIGGDSWEKCRRVAVGVTEFGKPICRMCLEEGKFGKAMEG